MAERVPHEIPRFDKIAGAILNAACGGPQGGGQEPDIIPPATFRKWGKWCWAILGIRAMR